MASKRQMMFIPEVNSTSFVFFFEKGDSGLSWSIRDYSIRNNVKTYRPHDFPWTADDIHQKAQYSQDAPAVDTRNSAYWHERTNECNRRHLGNPAATPSPPIATSNKVRCQSVHPKAFVSHSTQDRAFVEKFATDLRTKGIDVWYSKWEIKPGDSIRKKIEEGLDGCEFFIIVLSNNSITRPWVQTELDAATIRQLNGKVRKIIPIKIEDCGDLPPMLGSLCWEDFSTQPYSAALKRVVDSVLNVDVRPPLGVGPTAK
ncbi:MAG TPA: toll/interleukin-1 receptor domain-containing protein [Bryobacteraceae bacterium]